jgi:hypothetical protein
MLTFRDSLGRIHFHQEGFTVAIFRVYGSVHLSFAPLTHFGTKMLLVME